MTVVDASVVLRTCLDETTLTRATTMSYAPNVNIFRELQVLHDTGFLTGLVSPEEHWQQVSLFLIVTAESCIHVRSHEKK